MNTISRSSIWFKLAYFPSLQMTRSRSPIAIAGLVMAGASEDEKNVPKDQVSLCTVFWLICLSPIRLLITLSFSTIASCAAVVVGTAASIMTYFAMRLLVGFIIHLPTNTYEYVTSVDWWRTFTNIGLIVAVLVAFATLVLTIPLVKARVKAYKEKACPILEIV